jgi:hypothetical protein
VRLSVSCTAANLCAAVAGGSVWASPAPGHPPERRWRRVVDDAGTTAAGEVLNRVACVTGQLCMAVDGAGHVLSSRVITQPGSWRRQTFTDPGQNRKQSGEAGSRQRQRRPNRLRRSETASAEAGLVAQGDRSVETAHTDWSHASGRELMDWSRRR